MLGYLFTKVTTAGDKKMIFHTQCGKIVAIPIGAGKEESALVGPPSFCWSPEFIVCSQSGEDSISIFPVDRSLSRSGYLALSLIVSRLDTFVDLVVVHDIGLQKENWALVKTIG